MAGYHPEAPEEIVLEGVSPGQMTCQLPQWMIGSADGQWASPWQSYDFWAPKRGKWPNEVGAMIPRPSGHRRDDINGVLREHVCSSTCIRLTLKRAPAFEIAYSAGGDIKVESEDGMPRVVCVPCWPTGHKNRGKCDRVPFLNSDNKRR